MNAAGLAAGDEVTVRRVGDGEVLVAARGSRVRRHAGFAALRLPNAIGLATARDLDGKLLTYDHRLSRFAGTDCVS